MTSVPSAQPSAGEGGARASVLMVDDDALLRDTVASILSHLGYTPVLAATGEEALARLAEPPEPVLVILDLDMPGMGGAWALAMIRNQRPELPVVIASGHHSRVTAELAELFPRVSLMPKPYGLQDIRKLLA
ncbi:MAG: response regulator [Holophagaceae bacterium]|uniref:Response regulator n=1 Tax=Candidatus Geothrix odensensis TaxID=2954440 RepID=A0A936K650_9BACT|nr:response regulator [Candidatus Geothrix odensensis]